MNKVPYICGALTNLEVEMQEEVKALYSSLGDVCHAVLGMRAFVPHEHYDPILHSQFTPADVDEAERAQVCQKTNLLVVVGIAPSWGGGIEVEMAHVHGVPAVVFKDKCQKLSRLLLGNPAVEEVIEYETLDEIPELLRRVLQEKKQELAA